MYVLSYFFKAIQHTLNNAENMAVIVCYNDP